MLRRTWENIVIEVIINCLINASYAVRSAISARAGLLFIIIAVIINNADTLTSWR